MTQRGDLIAYWQGCDSAKVANERREGYWQVGRARHVVKGEIRTFDPDPTRSDIKPISKGKGDTFGRVIHILTVDHKPGAGEALEAFHEFAGEALRKGGAAWRDYWATVGTGDLVGATPQEVVSSALRLRDWIANWIDNNNRKAA